MPGILVVEDDENLNRGITFSLKKSGYEVFSAESVKKAKRIASDNNVDVTICDVNLPDGNGLEFVRWMRCNYNTYIICLTALDQEIDQVMGYEAGADDYITKPFGMMELVSRVKAVLRRSSRNEKKDEIIVGQLKIYPNKHKVKSCGNEVTLTNKEFKLLCLLVESKGNVLNRDQLLTNIWGYDFDGETRTVDVHIRSLRQKLGECGKLIETVRGIGYRIGGNES